MFCLFCVIVYFVVNSARCVLLNMVATAAIGLVTLVSYSCGFIAFGIQTNLRNITADPSQPPLPPGGKDKVAVVVL